MSRELRRVPPDWEHPNYDKYFYLGHPSNIGTPKRLHNKTVDEAWAFWFANFELWQKGEYLGQPEDRDEYPWTYAGFCDWHGPPPDPNFYRTRQWTEAEATAFQVYETVTEGTPLSPVLLTEDAVVTWLVGKGYSEQAARDFVRQGWAPSMVAIPGPHGPQMADDIHSFDLLREVDTHGGR